MILLLDANTLLSWLAADGKLSDQAQRAIADPSNDVIVSAASIWEIEVKRAVGRLNAPTELLDDLERAGIDALPLTGADAVTAARLPYHHRDPFDRMVIAQALRLDGIVVTRDRAFEPYGVGVLTA